MVLKWKFDFVYPLHVLGEEKSEREWAANRDF